MPSPISLSLTSTARRRRSNTLPVLSNLFNRASFTGAGTGQVNYAAFKVLPVDSARLNRESSATSEFYVATSDEMQSASTCREAADLIVDKIYQACEDVGGGQNDFLVREDIVRQVFHLFCLLRHVCTSRFIDTSFSLADAQRMTSVYAKMEYGVKRLLWFGS